MSSATRTDSSLLTAAGAQVGLSFALAAGAALFFFTPARPAAFLAGAASFVLVPFVCRAAGVRYATPFFAGPPGLLFIPLMGGSAFVRGTAALLAGPPGLFRAPLVGRAAAMGRPTSRTGDGPLPLLIHGSKASPAASSFSVDRPADTGARFSPSHSGRTFPVRHNVSP